MDLDHDVVTFLSVLCLLPLIVSFICAMGLDPLTRLWKVCATVFFVSLISSIVLVFVLLCHDLWDTETFRTFCSGGHKCVSWLLHSG